MLTRRGALIFSMVVLVALGGYFLVRGQTHLVLVAQRVHDIGPRKPTPRLVLAVIFANHSPDPIEISARAKLRVRSVNTGGEQSIRSDRRSSSTIPPGGSIELIYDLWQLANLYQQGSFRELRDSPGDMRFRLEVETDAGLFRSDEWSDVTSGSDVGELLRDLRGGVAL